MMMSKENEFNNVDNLVISSGKNFERFVSVKFLNEETVYFGVEKKCKVNELFSKICVHLGLADCAELFGIAIKQINYPTSLFGPLTQSSHYYSASQVEESIKQEDTQFEEEYIFLNPTAKLSKYTTKQWKNSKNGLDSMGKAYLQCFFRVQFYVDSYLFITDRIARHHYYLQLRENVINYNLANLTLERAFLLTSLALQAEKGNYNERHAQSKSNILNSTFINNENMNPLNNSSDLHKCYFDPYDYMPKWIVYQMGELYICENMPTMHKEQHGTSRIDAEIMFIKEASEICAHNLHMYRLFKSNPSSFNKKLTNVNNHFNAFFHGHHFNSSINSNSSYSSTMTNHSSSVSNNHSNMSNSSLSNLNKEGKVWLAISATGVQLYEQDKQIFINKSNENSFLDLNTQNQSLLNQDQSSSTVCFLRSKLSIFVWPDIEKLFFDKKKFEIRSNGYPTRKFTYYTHSDEMAKNLLWLCKMSHRFQLFIQPKLKEMKKRESELSRRKYRESYIYSDTDKSNSEQQENKSDIKLVTSNLMEYQQEPSSNKYSFLTKQQLDDSSLSASRNTLVGKESLNLSQNQDYHLKPLSDDMKPIMDKFDKQISKLQSGHQISDHNLIDLSTSGSLSTSSTKHSSSIKSDKIDNFDKLDKSMDQVDFMNGLTDQQKFTQLNTNPFLDKSNYTQLNFQMFHQQPHQQLENLDEFVIEHKADTHELDSRLTVQPSSTKLIVEQPQIEANSLKIKLNQDLDDSNAKPNKQTFSLESLTCSGLSEPSSSGISEQEFSTSSDHNTDRKSSSLLLCSPPNSENPHLSHLNHHLNNESPNSLQSRCSSNTSYSSDSALGKCNNRPMPPASKLPVLTQRITNYNKKPQDHCEQKLKQHAYSVTDLHKDYFSTINNNHLLEDFNQDGEVLKCNQAPKPRARKSKFEMKNKNKLNSMHYKSLPNVNDFSGNSRFGRLDISNEDTIEKERFNFLNRSDKSTSSEHSVSTIKSNNKTSSSNKLNDEHGYPLSSSSFGNNSVNSSTNQPWMLKQDATKQATDPFRNRIYENLPFQNSVNNLLNGNRTPTTSSFLPAPNLITTTPNRIATKIGVSSLNRCNKVASNHNSAHKNAVNNLRMNLFNTSLDRPNLRTCSYQLLNNDNLSTINDPNQSRSPFKTTRASSDPGVLTYSSTSNLMKVPSKDSFVFYQNSPRTTAQLIQPATMSNHEFNHYQMNLSSLNSPMFHRSLNNITGVNENATISNLDYDKPLINQINNQRKASLRKNQFHPLRLVESEMNLISSNTDHVEICLAPPPQFNDLENYKMKATSEQQLNSIDPTRFANKMNQQNQKMHNKQTDSIDNLQQLKQKSHDLDLPLISALFKDKSLMMLPKTVPCSRQQHQKPKRYSWHLENNNNSTSAAEQAANTSPSSSTTDSKAYQQTNLDDVSGIFDETPQQTASLSHPKYDDNYNHLKSNNLNNKLPQNSRDYIDKIWADHLLN